MALPSSSSSEGLQQLSADYLEEYNGRPLLIIAAAFIILQTCVLLLLIVSRVSLKSADGVATWSLTVLGYLSCIGICIQAICKSPSYAPTEALYLMSQPVKVKIGGTGRHLLYFLLTNPDTITKGLKLQGAQNYLYAPSSMAPKFVMITLYLRIFREKWIRRIAWIVGVFMILHAMATILASSLICRPFAYNWDKDLPNGHCGDQLAAFRYISLPNIVSDVAIILLPLPVLVKLQLSPPKKVGLILTFLTGGFGLITAVIRFALFFTDKVYPDFTYNGTKLECWAVVEPSVYFICACLPGIRPVVQRIGESETYLRLGSWLRSRSRTYPSQESAASRQAEKPLVAESH
ncbi:MAG: hypothetical protein Q9160_006356 [Pyrenula sp. 1 TL-2023]